MKTKRLSIDTWTAAGLSALVKNGPDALRAEPLARAIGTTKGSFYWHFADVPAFQNAVLKRWQSDAFAQVVTQLSATGSADARLRAFAAQIIKSKADPAIRAWAQSNKVAAQAVAQVDEQRLAHVARLLAQLDLKNPAFALSCYATLIGAATVKSDTTPQMAFDALIDLVLALQ
jgi:AcrR family transcriptional regulator